MENKNLPADDRTRLRLLTKALETARLDRTAGYPVLSERAVRELEAIQRELAETFDRFTELMADRETVVVDDPDAGDEEQALLEQELAAVRKRADTVIRRLSAEIKIALAGKQPQYLAQTYRRYGFDC
jgi:hypothetical protein